MLGKSTYLCLESNRDGTMSLLARCHAAKLIAVDVNDEALKIVASECHSRVLHHVVTIEDFESIHGNMYVIIVCTYVYMYVCRYVCIFCHPFWSIGLNKWFLEPFLRLL
jgi:hypothetical protein